MKDQTSSPSIHHPGYVEKSEQANGVLYKYSASWIRTLETEDHWRLYWQQQEMLQASLSSGDTIFEVGVGSGFTANYLRSKGYQVTTFDIDEEKCPDVVGNIVTYDFGGQSFDHVLAFEVFEHIPYSEFCAALVKLRAMCRKCFVMSVPIGRRQLFSVEVKLPRLRRRVLSWTRPKKRIRGGYHFWEVGFGETTETRLLADLESHGFRPRKTKHHLGRLFISCATD